MVSPVDNAAARIVDRPPQLPSAPSDVVTPGAGGAVDTSVVAVGPPKVADNASLISGLVRTDRGASIGRAGEAHAVSRASRRHPAGDIYFLGDSQTEGLRVWGRLGTQTGRGRDGDERATIDDHRGKTTKFFLQTLRSGDLDATLADEALIVVNFGGNDITGTEWSVERIQNNIRAVVHELRRINPDLRVVISDIPVRGRWLDAHPQQARTREPVLNAVNAWLRAGGDEGPAGTRFENFPANDFIAARDARGRLTRYQRREYRRPAADVHLNAAGYARLGEALRERFFATP